MKLESGFEITPCADSKFEEMAVELRFKGISVAQINKDKGVDKSEIDIPFRFSPANIEFKFELKHFLAALEAAQKMLEEI